MPGTSTLTTIVGWSAVSALGIGRAAFSTGLGAGESAVSALDRSEWPAPVDEAFLVPNFVIKDLLGRKGTRSMDRVTGLAVTAVGRLLDEQAPGGTGTVTDGASTALVLGTGTGSAQSIMDFTRDSLESARPYYVDPARFPNTVMNCASGQSAIWYGLRGPNTTISAGRVSGLQALNYASRLQLSGRADTVLCGAVEEFSSARAWLEWHSRREGGLPDQLGEGCAMLMLRPPGSPELPDRPVLADVLALDFGVFDPRTSVTERLNDQLGRLLERGGVTDRSEVALVSPSWQSGPLGSQEDEAISRFFGDHRPIRLRISEAVGDTAAAAAAFQVVAVLATAERQPELSGRLAVVTAVDRDGVFGSALLRLAEQPEQQRTGSRP